MRTKKLGLPQIRKSIFSFLLEEEGKVSKESLLKVGALVGTISALSNIAHAGHSQNIAHSQAVSATYDGTSILATHSHYDPTHASHGSHGNHTSHSVGGGGGSPLISWRKD